MCCIVYRPVTFFFFLGVSVMTLINSDNIVCMSIGESSTKVRDTCIAVCC